MNDLETLFRERIVSGLQRKSLNKCSAWAEKYRFVGQPFPGKFSFKYHPWQKEMHDSTAQQNVGQKAAQMGFTDTVLNITFYNIDIKNKDVLYVLPARSDASDFTASRFDPALEQSDHLSSIFTDVNNVGHKRAGSSNLYIRGSRARAGLKSIPVGGLVLDEVAEMTQPNIPLAFERMSGQRDWWSWMISTPTVDNENINEHYRLSSQNNFYFKCPSCSKFITFRFPESVVITAEDVNDPKITESHYICTECKAVLSHEDKPIYLGTGKWISTYPNRAIAGWHINQLYSSAEAGRPVSIAKKFLKSIQSKSDEQEFYNSTLGVTHAVEGARVTQHQIEQCKKDYFKLEYSPPNRVITMGVDQGRWIHYEIDAWQPGVGSDLAVSSKCDLITEGKVKEFEELDELMRQFRIHFCVIDAQPERRAATEFARRFRGHVRLCFYPEGLNPKQIHLSDAGDEPTVSVDRTTWLDTSLGRFRSETISLPRNVSMEYQDQIQVPVRVYSKDKHGNPIGRYADGNKDDHFAHARNYNEIALPLAVSLMRSENISTIRWR